MSGKYNYRLYQVRPKQSVQNSSSVQMEFTVPQFSSLIPSESYLEANLRIGVRQISGGSPSTQICANVALPDEFGLSPNALSCLFNNSDCLINNVACSYMKNIPACQTVLRLCSMNDSVNKMKSNSPIVTFSDYNPNKALCVYGTVGVNIKGGALESQTLNACAYKNSIVAQGATESNVIRLAGVIPSGLFYSEDEVPAGSNIQLTLNLDPQRSKQLFALSGLKAVGDTYHFYDSYSSLPALLASAGTTGFSNGYYISVELTDMNFYMALASSNSMPFNLTTPIVIKDINCIQKSASSASTFDETFTLPDGSQMCYIFTVPTNIGTGALTTPTIFKTPVSLTLSNVRVSFNGRQLNTPNYNLSPATGLLVTGEVITNNDLRGFTNGDMLDWARAYQEFLDQTNNQDDTCPLDFGAWLAQPVFAFNINKSPLEQGSELNVHFDFSASDAILTAFPTSVYVVTVRDVEVGVKYDENAKPIATGLTYLK